MIQEDYCSCEVSKLLREKSFDELCLCAWLKGDSVPFRFKTGVYQRALENDEYLCPTHQRAMKWLREEKNIVVNVLYNGADWNAEYYNDEDENFYLITNYSCNSYEDAVEASLKYCLENLI